MSPAPPDPPVVALRAPAAPEVRLRPFGGAAADLAVDFARPPSPALVTDVLACCAPGADAASVEALPVSTRLACLVALAGMEAEALDVPLRCPSCGEAMEVGFTVDELLGIADSAPGGGAMTLDADGARLVVRRPTGADQAAWRASAWADEGEAARALARSLLVEEDGVELTPARLAAVDAALEALDPLTALSVAAACPSCESPSVHEVDVAALTLTRLAAVQRRTIEEVHVLARRYHWSEAEVLAVPPRRRARYLALLDREGR